MSDSLWDLMPDSWRIHLDDCRADLAQIDLLLAEMLKQRIEVVPAAHNIFAALRLAPENVEVVVLGQDPYPNANYAIGVAFAVPQGTKPLPGSLRNIFSEIESDMGQPSDTDLDLWQWVEQGVLLLNTSLTTECAKSNAHKHLPWDRVVQTILETVERENPKAIGMLWGKQALQYSRFFDSSHIVVSAHPSPLSAHRGFLGSKPFSRANSLLDANKRTKIKW